MTNDAIIHEVGARVRAARADSGLSRKRLAEIADVSERYLNELEKGSANASIGILAKVATALGLHVSKLIPGACGPTLEADAKGAAIPPRLTELLGMMSPAEQKDAAVLLERLIQARSRSRRGVALLGLRGAGKTTLGRLLSERHGLPFVSITREIEARAGMSLADLFNLGGAEAYRTLENEVVADLARRQDTIVLESAGGIAGNSEALDSILRSYVSVWIKASPEEHLARVMSQGDMRPMHGNPRAIDQIRALLVQREAEYARAEWVLDTTARTPAASAEELERLVAPALATALDSRRSDLRVGVG